MVLQLLCKQRNQIFGEQITAAYQPDVEQECQNERLGTSLFEFLKTRFSTQCCHGHGKHESIDVLDGTVQWYFFHTVYTRISIAAVNSDR